MHERYKKKEHWYIYMREKGRIQRTKEMERFVWKRERKGKKNERINPFEVRRKDNNTI